jgi:hypothetical protein
MGAKLLLDDVLALGHNVSERAENVDAVEADRRFIGSPAASGSRPAGAADRHVAQPGY